MFKEIDFPREVVLHGIMPYLDHEDLVKWRSVAKMFKDYIDRNPNIDENRKLFADYAWKFKNVYLNDVMPTIVEFKQKNSSGCYSEIIKLISNQTKFAYRNEKRKEEANSLIWKLFKGYKNYMALPEVKESVNVLNLHGYDLEDQVHVKSDDMIDFPIKRGVSSKNQHFVAIKTRDFAMKSYEIYVLYESIIAPGTWEVSTTSTFTPFLFNSEIIKDGRFCDTKDCELIKSLVDKGSGIKIVNKFQRDGEKVICLAGSKLDKKNVSMFDKEDNMDEIFGIAAVRKFF